MIFSHLLILILFVLGVSSETTQVQFMAGFSRGVVDSLGEDPVFACAEKLAEIALSTYDDFRIGKVLDNLGDTTYNMIGTCTTCLVAFGKDMSPYKRFTEASKCAAGTFRTAQSLYQEKSWYESGYKGGDALYHCVRAIFNLRKSVRSANRTMVPPEWDSSCDPSYYDADDGCDCQCGAWDPDCNSLDNYVFGCDSDRYRCIYPGGCSKAVPDSWTCYPGHYNSSDGCDCDCGVADPDCESSSVVYNCMKDSTCSNGLCVAPSHIPVNWTCDPMYYNVSDGCDCGCGAVDPDCETVPTPVYGCPCDSMTCSVNANCLGYCDNSYMITWQFYTGMVVSSVLASLFGVATIVLSCVLYRHRKQSGKKEPRKEVLSVPLLEQNSF